MFMQGNLTTSAAGTHSQPSEQAIYGTGGPHCNRRVERNIRSYSPKVVALLFQN